MGRSPRYTLERLRFELRGLGRLSPNKFDIRKPMTFDKWPRQTCTPNLWIALVMSCSRTETRKGLWVLKAICEWRHSGYVYKP